MSVERSSPLHSPSSLHFASAIATAAILASLTFAACAPAKPSDPVSIVQAALDRVAEGDVDGFLAYFSDDAVFFSEGRPVTREAVRDELIQLLASEHRFEFSDLTADGNVVTYTTEVFFRNTSVVKSSLPVDVVVDGQIVFDGHIADLLAECERDSSQVFCGGD